MHIRGKDSKTVFILGAGATRGAVGHIVLKRKRLKPPLNSDFFKVAHTYARAQGANSADAKRLDRLNHFFREYLPMKQPSLNMETAFSLLFMAKDFPQIYGPRRGRRREAGDRPEIEDFLRLTYNILVSFDRASDGNTAYDRMVSKIGSNDTLISLNYDTLLDSALVRRGWNPKIGYCLGGGKRKVNWSPKQLDPEMENVCFLKLHGSLNWFVGGSFANLSSVFTKKPAHVENPRKNEISGYVRQIVPPIYGKFFGHDHWRSLWSEAYHSLCVAEELVVVGCSLVETDFHLRALLGRVTQRRKNEKRPFKRVVLVDRSKIRNKWAYALKGSYSKKSLYPSFEAFLKREVKV
jgi:hypothetical protein